MVKYGPRLSLRSWESEKTWNGHESNDGDGSQTLTMDVGNDYKGRRRLLPTLSLTSSIFISDLLTYLSTYGRRVCKSLEGKSNFKITILMA